MPRTRHARLCRFGSAARAAAFGGLSPPPELVFQVEVDFACPYCLAPISMLLDPSVPAQTYVEDCEVCCHPIEVAYESDGEDVTAFEARQLE